MACGRAIGAVRRPLRKPRRPCSHTYSEGTQGVIETELIWHNGEFVAWEDAKIHVLSHGLHYGTGVFEGIRCYETARGPAIFRHLDHLDRLVKSAELYYMPLPYTIAELR